MARNGPRKTLADYVTAALSPVLIMGLVGSLVFFLLEILYAGQYSGQLQWTLFFFVFAMVLIARISIDMGSERAGMYGLGMMLAGFLSLQAYLQFPADSPLTGFGWLVNLVLMVTIWWCSNKLTWDCTHIDDAVDASGRGLLDAAGMDQEAAAEGESADDSDIGRKSKTSSGLLGWWERYRDYRAEQQKKPHTPGVWVVYFSLAALPLFGLGQSLIPVANTERRTYVFWLMVCYVASGLSLLVTTSYLGLRRYLRQRSVRMPKAMTAVWLALGAGMIAVFMVLGALLPRPYGEYQLVHIDPLGSKERDASRYAMKSDGSGKGQGTSSSDPAGKDKEAQSGSGTKSSDDGQGQSQTKSGKGDSGKSKSGSGNKSGKGSQSNSKSQQKDDSTKNDEQSKDEDKRDQDDRKGENAKPGSSGKRAGSKSDAQKAVPRESESKNSARPSNPISSVLSKLGVLGVILKWILFAIIALVVGFFVLRAGLRFMANFTTWAQRLLEMFRSWWEALFGGGKSEGARSEAAGETEDRKPLLRPYSSFHNPFVDGRAEGMSPDELARYSFDALESWAFERDLARLPKETPLEFAARLVNEMPTLGADVQRMAGLYARVAYARGRLGPGSLGPLKQFWERLETVTERPLSV
jgi:hypothetical protein